MIIYSVNILSVCLSVMLQSRATYGCFHPCLCLFSCLSKVKSGLKVPDYSSLISRILTSYKSSILPSEGTPGKVVLLYSVKYLLTKWKVYGRTWTWFFPFDTLRHRNKLRTAVIVLLLDILWQSNDRQTDIS